MTLANDMSVLSCFPAASSAGADDASGARDCHLFGYLEARAQRDHDSCAIAYQGQRITYGDLHRAALCLAGYLQQHLAVRRGDPVLLAMRDGPQLAVAWYAVLRCDAVVVAMNPAMTPVAMARCASDTGARVAIAAQEARAAVTTLLGEGGLRGCIVAACPAPSGLSGSAQGKAPGKARPAVVHDFADALAAGIGPVPMVASGPDPAVLLHAPDGPGQPGATTLSHRGFARMADRAMPASPGGMASLASLHQAVVRGDTLLLPFAR